MEEVARSSNNTKNNNSNTPIFKSVKKQNVNDNKLVDSEQPHVVSTKPISPREYLKGLLESAGYQEQS